MSDSAVSLIKDWLGRSLNPEQVEWLNDQIEKVVAEPTPRNLQIAFGLVPRKLGKADLGFGNSATTVETLSHATTTSD